MNLQAVYSDFKGRLRVLLSAVLLFTGCQTPLMKDGEAQAGRAGLEALDARWSVGELVYADDFDDDRLANWRWELQDGGSVRVVGGRLEIDVPEGATVWLKRELVGPVLITYRASAIDAGGPNDRVSDLNCFWMARDARSPEDLFATQRSGKFADYHPLRTYYVGLGGNHNSTTRFRRYIGDPVERPMLPEHDLRDADAMLTPNAWQSVQLVACEGLIQYYRDGVRLFELQDPRPYTSGWFGIRTTRNRLHIDSLRIYRLTPAHPVIRGKP